jgi:translocation and assembly module TamA
VGSITGTESADIPANRRFYAGGGTSIRGYALQSVGPLTDDGTPIGGRSLLELSAELRVKLSKTLGGVVFIDGGNVYEETVPDFSNNLRWAAGFGTLYFTAVGPIRLDIGFPLNRRSIDDSFQFYISVGQAF